MRFPQHPRTRAFTLIELLVVIAIILILMGLAVPAFRASIAQQAPHSDADRLQSMLRAARQHAIVNNTRTRVVFATEDLETASRNLGEDEPIEAYRAFAAFRFHMPDVPATGTEPDSIIGGSRELASKNLISLPSAHVGQWLPLRRTSRWYRMNGNTVSLNSDSFANTSIYGDRALSTNPGALNNFNLNHHILNIFQNLSGEDREELLNDFLYFQPTQVWAPDTSFGVPFSPASQFPENYWQIPYPRGFSLISTEGLAPLEEVPVEQFTEPLFYNQIWAFGSPPDSGFGTTVRWTFFAIPEDREFDVGSIFADWSDEGFSFYNLPGIEYDNRGLPQFSMNRVVIRFAQEGNPDNYVDITVNRTDGIPRRIQPD
ncbi:MAG: prepilin-type N-terminal cleavage/methylation domain-containing protein [Opitutales bacterium]|nr:prepilin-type N-terminal cleavage/methylation domain-containing protein [Opitutales bacterium]